MSNNIKEALQVLKSVLDMATAKGVFSSIDASYSAAASFNIVIKALENDKQIDGVFTDTSNNSGQ